MSLADLYDEWFLPENRNWWFKPTGSDDEYLRDKYFDLLDRTGVGAGGLGRAGNGIEVLISKVILFDQLPRHIYRNEQANHIVAFFLHRAVSISKMHLLTNLDELNDEEYMFALLPFRHTNNVNHIMDVMKTTWTRINTLGESETLKRFLRATYTKCPKQGSHIGYLPKPDSKIVWNTHTFQNILEYAPLDICDVSKYHELQSNPCYAAIKAFVESPKKGGGADQPLIVSLSGGVDSMVCAALLKHFGASVMALHINYCNRGIEEEDFVVSWCHLMDIPIHVRRLSEIQRGPCMTIGMRDTYETYTRDVRFASYRALAINEPRVILGHNEDDCFENIMTNIAQKQKTDNLKGMDHIVMQSGTRFYRPLLNVNKGDIYAFAKQACIPFLQDSTPSWSQRGIIRDNVRPAIEKWHPGFVKEMLGLGDHIEELYTFMEDMVDTMIESCKLNKGCLRIPASFKSITSAMFWKHYLIRAHKLYASQKSLGHFIQRLEDVVQNKKKGNIHMSHDWHVSIDARVGMVSFVFKDLCM